MPFQRIVPNLVVADVARSIAFYRDALGFALDLHVPDAPPFVFASMKRDGVEVYLNDAKAAGDEYPPFKDRPLGGTLTLFTQMDGIAEYYETVKTTLTILLPLEKKWYGVWEFAVADPDGYIITFAQRGD
jgi:catechol 2,3-dioxygenase-like lactoylglutathione lyase family enzyme